MEATLARLKAAARGYWGFHRIIGPAVDVASGIKGAGRAFSELVNKR